MAILAVRRRAGTAVMVSLSKDGELQSGVMSRLGFRIVRGSSSRAGAKGLSGMVTALRDGSDAAFAVDGPRGPAGVAKPGRGAAAALSDAELLGVASAPAWAVVVRRAWDRFEIPLPFSRVAVVIGPAVSAQAARLEPELLGAAIRDARARAEALVHRVTLTGVLGKSVSS